MNEELKKWIDDNLWLDNRKQLDSSRYNKRFKFYKANVSKFEEIEMLTSFLPIDCKYAERVYCVIDDIKDIQICKVCKKNKLKYQSIHKGYAKGCSLECSHLTKEYIEKFRTSIFKKDKNGITPRERATLNTMKTRLVEDENGLNSYQKISITMKTLWDEYSDDDKEYYLYKMREGKIASTPKKKKRVKPQKYIGNRKKFLKAQYMIVYDSNRNIPLELKQNHLKNKKSFFKRQEKIYLNSLEYNSRNLYIDSKIKQTKKIKYGNPNYNNHDSIKETYKNHTKEFWDVRIEKSSKTCIERYGVDNPFKSEIFKDIIKTKRIESGNMFNYENKEYNEIYRHIVKYETNKSFIKYYHFINPKKLNRSVFEYHLDHNYSIAEGFKNSVPIWVLCHPCNLRMMYCKDNISKSKKCDITLDELINNIKFFEENN